MNFKCIFIFILFSFSCSVLKAQEICPDNNPEYFCLSPSKNQNQVMNEKNFYEIPGLILTYFTKEIFETGYPVLLDAQWASPYFGAGVSLYENAYHLMILGGTTRISQMTEDAYAAIVCHEVGHILGGEPRQTIPFAGWSSSEGQADFFAASVCLPRYFKKLHVSRADISKRVERAGFEMMNALKKYDTNSADRSLNRTRAPLPPTEETLINQYPTIQCRYENFRNPKTRPACWFKN